LGLPDVIEFARRLDRANVDQDVVGVDDDLDALLAETVSSAYGKPFGDCDRFDTARRQEGRRNPMTRLDRPVVAD